MCLSSSRSARRRPFSSTILRMTACPTPNFSRTAFCVIPAFSSARICLSTFSGVFYIFSSFPPQALAAPCFGAHQRATDHICPRAAGAYIHRCSAHAEHMFTGFILLHATHPPWFRSASAFSGYRRSGFSMLPASALPAVSAPPAARRSCGSLRGPRRCSPTYRSA